MQTTTNIGLKTYEANDPTDWLGEFNYNMNKIDTAVGAQNDAIDVIEETAGTAVTTANTASDTASEALQTASTKASIDDNVASATTTYSSNKINELISGITPESEIDDSVTSLTKTWSSNKINTEIDAVETIANSKASINDTTYSTTTTYSSKHIRDALCLKPTIVDDVDITSILSSGSGTLTIRPWEGDKFLYYIGVKNGANKYVKPYVFMSVDLDCIINVNGVNIEVSLSSDGQTLYITKKSGTLSNNYYLTIYSLCI